MGEFVALTTKQSERFAQAPPGGCIQKRVVPPAERHAVGDIQNQIRPLPAPQDMMCVVRSATHRTVRPLTGVIVALEHGWTGVHAQLARERRRAFLSKRRFNRALRTLVGSPLAVRVASAGALYAPSVVRALILHASDCDLVESRR